LTTSFLYSGELKIAEVVSRFSDLDTFITLLESLGFEFMDKVIQKIHGENGNTDFYLIGG
jgi:hypothetical protein